MDLHFTRHDRRPESNITGTLAVLALTLWCSAVVIGQVAPATTHLATVTLDAVDVGRDAPPGRLMGFGPPEPQTHGGSWGGAPRGNFYRVLWFQDDEPFGIVELAIPPHTVAQKVEIDYLNGISGCSGSPAGDTFDVYAASRVDPLEWT